MDTTMRTTAPPRRIAELRGRAFGVTILAFFAVAWTGWGTSNLLTGSASLIVMGLAVLASVGLATTAWHIARRAIPAASTQENTSSGDGTDAGRDVGRRFGLIVAAEWVGLGIVAGILGGTGHAQVIPAVICLGVGTHFFPLARLFHVPVYYLTGAVLSLLAVATVILAPATSTPTLWTALPGIGAAVTLYATCVSLLSDANRLPRD